MLALMHLAVHPRSHCHVLDEQELVAWRALSFTAYDLATRRLLLSNARELVRKRMCRLTPVLWQR